jgi:DNA-binding CsgD family transcriptional regulator
MPAIVRARLSAGLAAHDSVLVDDGRAHRASRPDSAHAVYVTEWPHADDAGEPRGASVFLLDPGVVPPTTQLARASTAWLPLDAEADDVIGAAHAVIRGMAVVSPVVLPTSGTARERSARRESRMPAVLTAEADDEPHLTERELQVLRLLAEGLGNKQIGAQLGISASTVKYHLQAIFTKLGVRTRSEAVSYGLRSGVVPL